MVANVIARARQRSAPLPAPAPFAGFAPSPASSAAALARSHCTHGSSAFVFFFLMSCERLTTMSPTSTVPPSRPKHRVHQWLFPWLSV